MTLHRSSTKPFQQFSVPVQQLYHVLNRIHHSFHTTTVSFRLQGTSEGSLFSALLKAEITENSRQDIPASSSHLGSFQEWRLHSIPRQPALVLNYLHTDFLFIFFLFGIGNSCFSLWLFFLTSSTTYLLLGPTEGLALLQDEWVQ